MNNIPVHTDPDGRVTVTDEWPERTEFAFDALFGSNRHPAGEVRVHVETANGRASYRLLDYDIRRRTFSAIRFSAERHPDEEASRG